MDFESGLVGFCLGVLVLIFLLEFALFLNHEGFTTVFGGASFVRVDILPVELEVDWCEEWVCEEFRDTYEGVCETIYVDDKDYCLNVLGDVYWPCTEVVCSPMQECVVRSRIWRRC